MDDFYILESCFNNISGWLWIAIIFIEEREHDWSEFFENKDIAQPTPPFGFNNQFYCLAYC